MMQTPPEFPISGANGRNRIRFRIWHLLGFVAFLAISIASCNALIEASRSTNATVEITGYNRVGQSTGSIEYVVHLPHGFAVSSVSVTSTAPKPDYSLLVGTKRIVRYRSGRCLWFGPEDPSQLAHNSVETQLKQFATAEMVGDN